MAMGGKYGACQGGGRLLPHTVQPMFYLMISWIDDFNTNDPIKRQLIRMVSQKRRDVHKVEGKVQKNLPLKYPDVVVKADASSSGRRYL